MGLLNTSVAPNSNVPTLIATGSPSPFLTSHPQITPVPQIEVASHLPFKGLLSSFPRERESSEDLSSQHLCSTEGWMPACAGMTQDESHYPTPDECGTVILRAATHATNAPTPQLPAPKAQMPAYSDRVPPDDAASEIPTKPLIERNTAPASCPAILIHPIASPACSTPQRSAASALIKGKV